MQLVSTYILETYLGYYSLDFDFDFDFDFLLTVDAFPWSACSCGFLDLFLIIR